GGGTISTATIANVKAAGYTGMYLDPRYIWDMSGVTFNGVQDFMIESRMIGSIGWTGNIEYNTNGYIATSTGGAASGVSVCASSPSGSTSTQGVIFKNCTIVGNNPSAVIQFGGGQRRCGLVDTLVYNTAGSFAAIIGSGL